MCFRNITLEAVQGQVGGTSRMKRQCVGWVTSEDTPVTQESEVRDVWKIEWWGQKRKGSGGGNDS